MIKENTLENLFEFEEANENRQSFSTRSKRAPSKPATPQKTKIYSSYKSKKESAQYPQQSFNGQRKKLSKWTQHRVQNICRRFIRKLKQGIVLQTPYQADPDQNQFSSCYKIFGNMEGFDPFDLWIISFDMMCLVMRFFLGILYSLDVVFDFGDMQIFLIAQIVGAILFFIEIVSNFVIKLDKQGKRIKYIRDISKQYLSSTFITDLIYFGLILSDLASIDSKIVSYVRLVAAAYKLLYSLQSVSKIQKISFSSHQAQQVWGICLVLVVNFIFAHIISLVLNGMAHLNPQQNWWYQKNCQDEPWYVKYTYGAYWGTNIMLTVGFGDIVASNWIQAICIIFIEMISCIVLSYNISCLGGLITNLRKNSQQKNINIRLFNQLYQQQTASRTLKPNKIKDRVYQFIEGHFQNKKKFNLADQKTVLSLFPRSLKEEYQNQIYLPVFKYLPYMRKFTSQTLKKLVSSVQKIFVHPDSFIVQAGDRSKILILSKGEVSYVFRKKNKQYTENNIIQKVSASKGENLLSIKQVFSDDHSKYNILSTQFSIIHVISGEAFREIIRQHSSDFQKMCLIRDQMKDNDFVLSCLECKLCHDQRHSKFSCPLLHYSPLKQIVISKSQSFTYKQNRVYVTREKPQKWRNLMRKAELSQIPKTDKNLNPTPTMIKKQNRHRRPTISFQSFEQLQSDYDRIHHWSFYFPKYNKQFRKEQDLESDSD